MHTNDTLTAPGPNGSLYTISPPMECGGCHQMRSFFVVAHGQARCNACHHAKLDEQLEVPYAISA